MALKAILLDFDGVIAETDNHHIAAWQRTLAALGWQLADDVAARAAEVDDSIFLGDLFGERSISSTKIQEWVRRKQELTVQMMRSSPRVYRGVAAFVKEVEGRVRLAVVSGTWRENVETVLDAAGIASAFDTIVSKEDVTSFKPHPEPYVKALKRLRVSPRSAVAFEDSPAGLESARSAGLQVIAVGHRRPFGDWVGDAAFISGFEPTDLVLRRVGLSPRRSDESHD
jgi:HAD superfamily hydrolase (TIGR01509 family)